MSTTTSEGKGLSRQEIFDKAVRGVIAQGVPALSADGYTCFYRGPHGVRCAVGFILTDEVYEPGMEGKSPTDFHVREALLRLGVDEQDIQFVADLQDVHDYADRTKDDPAVFIASFRRRATDLAETYGLSTEALA